MKNTIETPPTTLDRTTNENASPNPHHDEAWNAAFHAQLTPEVMEHVMRYAQSRALWVMKRTGIDDVDLAENLHQDALTDTWLGRRSWNPENVPLMVYLRNVIKSRTSDLVKHAKRFPRDVLDPTERDRLELVYDAHTDDRIDELEARKESDGVRLLSDAPESASTPASRAAEDLLVSLYRLAEDDEHVLSILDCYRDDVIERADVMRTSGLSRTDYHNARRRLTRLIADLPQRIRDAALDVIA